MDNKKPLTYIISVLAVSFLYSSVYFFFPLKKMAETCFYSAQMEGKTYCVIAVALVFMALYMFLPLLTAVVLQKLVYKEPLADIGFTFKWSYWYFFAWLAPLVINALSMLAALLMPGASFDPTLAGYLEKIKGMVPPEQFEMIKNQVQGAGAGTIAAGIAQSMVAGVTINALFAFGEEAGWRGFFLNSLKGRGFFSKCVIIGVIWGIWHFPVIIQGHNYPQHPVAGVFMMILWCILLTIPMVYVTQKTGSVIAAAVFHGTLNASAGFVYMYINGGNDLTAGPAGFNSMLALLVFNSGILLYDRYIEKEKVVF